MIYEPFSRTVTGYTEIELEGRDDKQCPSCLSDGLYDDDIKPDGLCEECTECTECERCGEWKLHDDMADKEYCCDCFENWNRERKSIEETNKCLDYGIL